MITRSNQRETPIWLLPFARPSSVLLFLFLVLIATPAFSRTVRGVVRDSDGKAVSGAAVRLKNTENLRIRSARTRRDGTYRFAGLSPRTDYELRASYGDRSSGWVRFSRFDEGDERVVDLTLK